MGGMEFEEAKRRSMNPQKINKNNSHDYSAIFCVIPTLSSFDLKDIP